MADYINNDCRITAVPYTAGMEHGFSDAVPSWVDYNHLIAPNGPYPYFETSDCKIHWLKPGDHIVTFHSDQRTTVLSAAELHRDYSALIASESHQTLTLINRISDHGPCPENCPNYPNKPANEGCGQEECLDQILELSAQLLGASDALITAEPETSDHG